MAVYDLEEQEQLSVLKAWWDQNGTRLIATVLVALLAVVGWQGWNWHKREQSAEASTLFYTLQVAAAQGDVARTRDVAGQLISKFGGTAYAQMGALIAGSLQFDGSDLDNAASQLTWAAEKGADANFRDLARLRLAAVLLAQEKYDQALAKLEPVPDGHNAFRFNDLRGDILAAQGKTAEARTAYQTAAGQLAQTDTPTTVLHELVLTKMESLED